MTEETKTILEFVTIAAASATALFNLIAVLVRSKTDPSVLSTANSSIKASSKAMRQQTKRIDKVNDTLVGQLTSISAQLATIDTKLSTISSSR